MVRNDPSNIRQRRIQVSLADPTLKQQLHYSCVAHGLVLRLKGMHNQKVDGELNSFGFLFMCWCSCFLFLAVIWGFWWYCKVRVFTLRLKKFELEMNPNLIPENLMLKGNASLDLNSSFVRAFLQTGMCVLWWRFNRTSSHQALSWVHITAKTQMAYPASFKDSS